MILAVMNAIYAIAYIEAWKGQDFNGVWTIFINYVWTRDLAIQVWFSVTNWAMKKYHYS